MEDGRCFCFVEGVDVYELPNLSVNFSLKAENVIVKGARGSGSEFVVFPAVCYAFVLLFMWEKHAEV